MNYHNIYNQLIERAQLRASSKKEANLILGYSEGHHIIPKCLGGTNEKSNIAYLSAREHLITHIMLVKIYPNHKGLLYSCHRLLHDKQGNKLNGKSYDWLKRKISEMSRSKTKENDKGVAKIAKALLGRTAETHEYIAIASAKKKLLNRYNCPGLATSGDKRKSFSKKTNSGVLSQSEKLSSLPSAQRAELVRMKQSGMTNTQIHQHFLELGFQLGYSTISRIYHREIAN
jgi:5-methylcytosine-specific restriction endonuclease McrA